MDQEGPVLQGVRLQLQQRRGGVVCDGCLGALLADGGDAAAVERQQVEKLSEPRRQLLATEDETRPVETAARYETMSARYGDHVGPLWGPCRPAVGPWRIALWDHIAVMTAGAPRDPDLTAGRLPTRTQRISLPPQRISRTQVKDCYNVGMRGEFQKETVSFPRKFPMPGELLASKGDPQFQKGLVSLSKEFSAQ